MRYVWLSDVDLDRVDLTQLGSHIVDSGAIGTFITGNVVSNAAQLTYTLSALERFSQRNIYVVLGNRDFYNSDFASVRAQMKSLTEVAQFVKYVPTTSYVVLSRSTALVGHDGWCDVAIGNARGLNVHNDWAMIKDLAAASGGYEFMSRNNDVRNRDSLIEVSRKNAHECVMHVRDGIAQAVRYHKNIIVMTHFPPFRELLGQGVDESHVPWNTCKLMGDVLLSAASTFKNVKFNVLCGHSSTSVVHSPLSNLTVTSAGPPNSSSVNGFVSVEG